MSELGPLGLQPHDKGIGAFPTFPSYSMSNLSQLSSEPSSYDWLTGGDSAPSPIGDNSDSGDTGDSSSFSGPGSLGSLSGGQAANSFFSGAARGISGYGIGKAAEAIGMDPNGIAAKAVNFGAKAAARAMGVPGLPAWFLDSLVGGVRNLAEDAKNSVGPRGNSPSWSDTVRGNDTIDMSFTGSPKADFNGDLSFGVTPTNFGYAGYSLGPGPQGVDPNNPDLGLPSFPDIFGDVRGIDTDPNAPDPTTSDPTGFQGDPTGQEGDAGNGPGAPSGIGPGTGTGPTGEGDE